MVMVATFKEQKGHRYLVEAALPLVTQFPDVQFLLIGDGDLKDQIMIQVSESNLDEHFHFLGMRDDVPDLLAASDCFVLPSLWEGLPMALIEAMASGLPVIASDVSGTRQVMISGETGLLVPPGDAGQLTQAMLQLLRDPGCAQAMGVAAKRRVEAYFSARKQAQDHVSLFLQDLITPENLVEELSL
jgi:glycosyltransferase involved in cell wall biosynthesis